MVIVIGVLIYLVEHRDYINIYMRNTEGYQSLTDCKEQGYPHDFCMKVRIQSVIYDTKSDCKRGY
jgi:hypothetical protein